MGYRDADSALRLRLEQMEHEVAEIPALREEIRRLTEDNARWKAQVDRLQREVASLRPTPPAAAAAVNASTVPGRVLFSIPQASGVNKVLGFDQSIIKIGRNPQCHLVLDGDDVSRMHAVVEVTDEDAVIIDLGSTTGTQVNGQKINKRSLQPGDRVRIGRYEMIFGIRR